MAIGVLTFKVKKDSEFYKKYFEAQEERKFFMKLAKDFFDKYNIDGSYYHCHDLEVNFRYDAVRQHFKDQLCSRPDKKGFYRFKKASPMNKEWRETVTGQVDFQRLNQCDLWFLDVMMSGWHSMWYLDDEIYGMVESEYQDDIKSMDYMEPIKRSEYYAAMERAEEIAQAANGGMPLE
jgi:hypothetical protein